MLFHPTYILSKRRNDHHQLIIPLSFRPAREIDRKKPKPFHQNFLVSTDPIYHPTLSSRLDKIEESRKDSRHVARERMGPREEGNLSRIINSGRQKAGRVPSVCSAGGIKRTKGIMPCSSNRGRDPSRGGVQRGRNGQSRVHFRRCTSWTRHEKCIQRAHSSPRLCPAFSDQKLPGRGGESLSVFLLVNKGFATRNWRKLG